MVHSDFFTLRIEIGVYIGQWPMRLTVLIVYTRQTPAQSSLLDKRLNASLCMNTRGLKNHPFFDALASLEPTPVARSVIVSNLSQ